MSNIGQFSPNGEFWAHLSPDGCLKIWNTSSNILKQEYTPSSHLSATCVVMAWCPGKYDIKSPKKRKLKNNSMKNSIADLNFIAMGTLTGEILLYSVNKGDLHTKMTGGHNDAITGISWFEYEDSIYTCAKDNYITKWCVSSGEIITKWKSGKTAMYSIAVVDSINLLSASNEIFLWDTKTQTLLKKFTGHATEVFCLLPIHVSDSTIKSNYFISSAINDRVVNVWQIESSDHCKSIASFVLNEEPLCLNVSEHVIKPEPLVLSVITKVGALQIFHHQLNGPLKKPLSPISSLCIASLGKNDEKSKPISALSSKYLKSSDTFLISYGKFLNPVFETMQINLSEKENYIIRDIQAFSEISLEGVSKTRAPEKPTTVKLLAPGYMTAAKLNENASRKKKRKDSSSQELPMEEKLNALYIVLQEENIQQEMPTSNSMAHLLLQGLQSQDSSLLNIVLNHKDDTLIETTVSRLPLNSIPLLLKELHKRLSKREQAHRPSLRWLKGIFRIHLSYLMSLQDIDEYIGPISQLIEAREETLSKMCQLKGFLDILWSQIESKNDESNNISSEAMLEYEETSSSSEEDDDEDNEEEDDKKLEEELHFKNSSSSEESNHDLQVASSDESDMEL